MNTLRIGLVSISDRASSGVYQDKGIPALEEWLARALTTPFELQTRLIPDEQVIIEQTLCELVDEMGCHLVLTTGGTGPEHAPVMLATLVAIISTFIQIAIVFARGKKPEPMLWISLAVIVVFGSLTIWLQNEMFIKWKPSILYWIFGGILTFAHCTGRNYIKKLMSAAEIELTDALWNTLQKAWIAFFAIVGVINLAVAYTCSTDTWVNFKLFGLMGMTFIFTIGVTLCLAKYMVEGQNSSDTKA